MAATRIRPRLGRLDQRRELFRCTLWRLTMQNTPVVPNALLACQRQTTVSSLPHLVLATSSTNWRLSTMYTPHDHEIQTSQDFKREVRPSTSRGCPCKFNQRTSITTPFGPSTSSSGSQVNRLPVRVTTDAVLVVKRDICSTLFGHSRSSVGKHPLLLFCTSGAMIMTARTQVSCL